MVSQLLNQKPERDWVHRVRYWAGWSDLVIVLAVIVFTNCPALAGVLQAPTGTLFDGSAANTVQGFRSMVSFMKWALYLLGFVFCGWAFVSMGQGQNGGSWGWKLAAGLGCLFFPNLFALFQTFTSGDRAPVDYNLNE